MSFVNDDQSVFVVMTLRSSACSAALESLESANFNWACAFPWVKSKILLNFFFKGRFDVETRDDDEGFEAKGFGDIERNDGFSKTSPELDDAFSVFGDFFDDAFLVFTEDDGAFETDFLAFGPVVNDTISLLKFRTSPPSDAKTPAVFAFFVVLEIFGASI